MSETPATSVQAPTVYFIDDSATMREVIKIAFRKENINVVTFPNAASALGAFETARPDVVISDVIMPDKDGYELCTFIKQHAALGSTPVILMSGVVNRQVAEKAMAVKADELLRKPFQPQELISRVKALLKMETPAAGAGAAPAVALGGLFGASPAPAAAPSTSAPAAGTASPPVSPALAPPRPDVAPPTPTQSQPVAPRPAAPPPARTQSPAAPAGGHTASSGADAQKLRFEIQRLEMLVQKLRSELQAERQYCQALEAHIRAMQGCN
jgi:CheY-like chemotaxis protein